MPQPLPEPHDAPGDLVRGILELLRDHRLGVVEVAGNPSLANRLRAELGRRVVEDETPHPVAVVDATGSAHVIRAALRRLADRGVLILTHEIHGGAGDLDYYEDIHRRGLTVAGL